jgi:hypothetical protein
MWMSFSRYKNKLTHTKPTRYITSNENNPKEEKKHNKIRFLINNKEMDEKNILSISKRYD